jgi:hypothetical protein
LYLYGKYSFVERIAQKWFGRIKEGNFDVTDTLSSGQQYRASGGIIHYGLLERNLAVTDERYCQQPSPPEGSNPAKTPGSTT